ncbi:MAG: threonine synthase [Candidatus Hodarchaeales archaeon]|jgi:threonine synthase
MIEKKSLQGIGSNLQLLVCTACSKHYDPKNKLRVCPACGKVLFAEYDMESAKEKIQKNGNLSSRTYDLWRFFEIMPVHDPRFRYTLGEGWTPLIHLKNQPRWKNIYLKDEGLNPTGTFKSRGLCAAISRGSELRIKNYAIPTAGNAGVALSAYSTKANKYAHVFMPENTPPLLKSLIILMGGKLRLVPGLITEAAAVCRQEAEKNDWFDVSTLKEPYRVEGKKTMAFEVVEQMNWLVPDVIIYPTGGGTGIVGMWKAFDELEQLGLIGSERPKMVTVQSSGCAPICKAFHEGRKTSADFWEGASTLAPGLRVPEAFGDYLILKALYESNGTAVTVDDSEIISSLKELSKSEGILQAPEGAATFAALKHLKESGFITPSDSVVLFGTGSGLIYPLLLKEIAHNKNSRVDINA